MNTTEKALIILLVLNVVSWGVTAAVVASYPKPQEDGTLQYYGWTIYMPDENATSTFIFVATKLGANPMQGADLPDLLSDIYEAEQ